MMSNDAKSINLKALDNLSEREKQLALEILKQYSESGESELFDQLKYSDFDEIPVSIDKFMHDPKYLGKALTDQEGRFTVFPYWENCLKDIFPDNLTTKYNNIVFTGAIGLGKAQPLDSLVLTVDGYKKMGELTFDDKVYGADGKPHKITGIFPQGKKKVCKASFTDGTSTLCCDEHLWTVKDGVDGSWQTLEARQIIENGFGGNRYEIPMAKPVRFAKSKPYGWLSDSVHKRIKYLGEWLNDAAYDGGFRFPNDHEHANFREGLRFLTQSLGGTCVFEDDGGWSYIDLRLPKKIRGKLPCQIPEEEPHRYISNIEYTGEDECQCIMIDSRDHLYLTNDFIATHNSTIAVICLLYMLYRLLCLKDPYLYYGMQPIDKITISLMNITLENAKGVALDKMNQMILQSDWFMAHGTMGGTTNLVYRPEKHIEFVTASSNNQIIGRAIFANFTDECNFGLVANPEKQKKRMLKLITQIDARMKSRFMRGTYLPTLNILASSKDTEQSFLEDYISTTVANNQKNTLVVDEPQWVVDPRKDSPQKFWVGIGNKMLANELIPLDVTERELDEYRAKGYELWQVPIGYLDTFQKNLDEAICSIIGIATASSLKYISGEKVSQVKTSSYKNPFVKDIIEVGNAKDDYLQYSNFFDMSAVDPEDMGRPLFVHLDMSMTGDKTGIAGVWITGREPNSKRPMGASGTSAAALEQTSFDDSGLIDDLHYKLAFSVSVKAPKGAQVSFAKNLNFLRWLREQGFNVKNVSTDTFQSAQLQQSALADGFKTNIISVDRLTKDANGKAVCLPYHYLKTMIYERHVTMYQKCDLLTDELIGLERKSDGHVDHTKAGINCLSGDTLVSLTDGREVSMEQLVQEYNEGKENFVYSVNHETGKIEARKIENAWCSGESDDLVKVRIDNGTSVVCTANHRFMLRDGTYKMAKDLQEGDSLMPLSTVYDQKYVDKIEKLTEKRKVYDLTIQANHNFALSNGIFVHNSKDQSDAFCGAMWAASHFAEEYSYQYGDSLTATLEVNSEDGSDNYRKQKILADFEAELSKITMDYNRAKELESKQKQEDAQYYADLNDGIIIL